MSADRKEERPVYLRPYNFSNHQMGFEINKNASAWIMEGDNLFYLVSPGLTGDKGTVSLKSADHQDLYLRHYQSLLDAESKTYAKNPEEFDQDATFHLRKDLWHRGCVSFESVNYPNHYIRHEKYRLQISQPDGTDTFIADASFYPIEDAGERKKRSGPMFLQSTNLPEHQIGFDVNDDLSTWIMKSGKLFNLVSPGLTGVNGTVSLESADRPDLYLRHYDDLLDVDSKNFPRNPSEFLRDATFILREDLWHKGYSFESVNFPNYYIRHENYRLQISEPDGSDTFTWDATFCPIQVPQ